ncbi:MAG: FemAB family PEP-CTERM system-associated protein [Erythrobacter sp.]|jgi:FemAB-related protein (PEP-CTERM system-associated)|uniref:FemAB family XrtA/PEP-CTERM system-associated protein n=1 Tax=Erythrobacter sp. TaxID=1042 RepID=UPI002B4A9588|nr:FemAB family XrtA/PEP-CTERM system-associated protein [Erythrobacter sp.]WRH71150.1 MAG: FemAB family PEP-CTERM system-associated protein [Erythrobacter sp.]
MNAPLRAGHQLRVLDWSDAGEVSRIEGFVAECGGSLFHRPAWLRAVAAGTGQRPAGLVSERLGVVTGWLPLTEVRSALFGKALVSSGFGVGGGILAEGREAERALASAAEDHAVRHGFSGIELRGGPIPEHWDAWDDKHCGFERPLAGDDEAELTAIPRKARAEVRKGLGFGHRITIGRAAGDLAAHYACFSESVRNLGTPVFPRSLFKAMLEAFPDSSDILTVWDGTRPLASVLSFYHAGAVMPFWGGGVFAARGARANEVMYYELMLHARRQGMTRFDFGRSKTGSGPFAFKKNWGFAPQPLTYGGWTAPGQPARNIDPTDASYSRKIDLWKKLPLPLANTLGPWIARGLA